MSFVRQLEERIYGGHLPSEEDVRQLCSEDVRELKECACRLRRHFSEDHLCFRGAIYFPKDVPFSVSLFQQEAQVLAACGAKRIHVRIGRSVLPPQVFEEFCHAIQWLVKKKEISIGISHGLLTPQDFACLLKSGCTWYHEFLGLQENLFNSFGKASVSYQEKIQMLNRAKDAGMTISTGCFWDMGETLADRITLYLAARDLGVGGFLIRSPEYQEERCHWVPSLSYEERCRSVSILRFVLPAACIIMDCQPNFFTDRGRWLLESGANGTLSGITAESLNTAVPQKQTVCRELGFLIS